MGTTVDRFQVCDPVCGLVGTEPRRADALAFARCHAAKCNGVVVWDLMAHRGAAETWAPDGQVLERKLRQ